MMMKYTYFINLCWLNYLQPFGVVPCFEDGDLILIGKVNTTYNCLLLFFPVFAAKLNCCCTVELYV